MLYSIFLFIIIYTQVDYCYCSSSTNINNDELTTQIENFQSIKESWAQVTTCIQELSAELSTLIADLELEDLFDEQKHDYVWYEKLRVAVEEHGADPTFIRPNGKTYIEMAFEQADWKAVDIMLAAPQVPFYTRFYYNLAHLLSPSCSGKRE